VALEVGTEGKLGGQATVKGVGGVWKDLTDSVNQMAGNLHSPSKKYCRGYYSGGYGRFVQENYCGCQGRVIRIEEYH
jgi:hypothetical protein